MKDVDGRRLIGAGIAERNLRVLGRVPDTHAKVEERVRVGCLAELTTAGLVSRRARERGESRAAVPGASALCGLFFTRSRRVSPRARCGNFGKQIGDANAPIKSATQPDDQTSLSRDARLG